MRSARSKVFIIDNPAPADSLLFTTCRLELKQILTAAGVVL